MSDTVVAITVTDEQRALLAYLFDSRVVDPPSGSLPQMEDAILKAVWDALPAEVTP